MYSEYDENGFNCKAFITFINRYGYYVIENMVGDNYLEKYQDEINQLKLIVQNSDETENIFETVTESIEIISKNKTKSNQDSKTKYTIKSNSIFNDRKILSFGDGYMFKKMVVVQSFIIALKIISSTLLSYSLMLQKKLNRKNCGIYQKYTIQS